MNSFSLKFMTKVLCIFAILIGGTLDAAAWNYSNWNLGDLKSEISTDLKQVHDRDMCFDADAVPAQVTGAVLVSSAYALDTIAAAGIDIDNVTALKEPNYILQNSNAVAVDVYIHQETGEIQRFIYVPYPVEMTIPGQVKGFMVSLVSEINCTPGIPCQCVECTVLSGYETLPGNECSCGHDFQHHCGANPVCPADFCQTCLISSNANTFAVDTCDPHITTPEDTFFDQTPLTQVIPFAGTAQGWDLQ